MKSILENKCGQGRTNPWMIAGVITMVVLVISILALVVNTQLGEDGVSPGTTGACALDSSLTIVDVSKIAGGTAPSSPTITAGVCSDDDTDCSEAVVATSITSGNNYNQFVGKRIVLLVSDTDSLDEKFIIDEFDCGGETVAGEGLYYSTSDNPGLKIKNDEDNFMTDHDTQAIVNQTKPSAGASVSLDAIFEGTSLESSGDLIWVVELPAGSSGNVTTLTVDGSAGIDVPVTHGGSKNAGSKIGAFEIPALVNSVKSTHILTIGLGGSSHLTGGVLTDWYAKQWFIDDDKTLEYGVEDSDGTAKYENTGDDDFAIDG